MRRENGLAHEVAEGGAPAQTAGAMNQFPHVARLRGALRRRKLRCLLAFVMPARADYLLIDVSNSFTKLAFSSTKKIGATERIPTPSLGVEALRKVIARRAVDRIVVCSVVPKKDAIIRRAAGKLRVTFVTAQSALGVGVEYPKPESIGADRLANAAAVAEIYGCPAIVVDFGTAVTFDVVSAKGSYIGGVIAPGLEAMTSYLYKRTALLPELTLTEPRSAVGKSTRAAMLAGAVFGYRGLVKEILAQISAEAFVRQKVRVIATGGYAQLIAQKMPQIDAVHPHLTLEGLRIVGNLEVVRRAGR